MGNSNQYNHAPISLGDITEFKEVLGIEKLTVLLEQFSRATGLSTYIMDLNGKILHEVSMQSICMEFHRKYKIYSKRCVRNDIVLAYRSAMTKEQAMEEIKRNSGTQFGPAIAQLFLNIVSAE